uniref:Mini-chromosome maintenance complex-binding protein n=1 Tax=Timema poppense TaxID=170557 RepID=A0A7R9D9U8_TIMPO|nr:unnamed protein product [Timema poppensis]
MSDWTIAHWEANTSECKRQLECPRSWKSIPCVNWSPLLELTDGQLVRFHGMIQDMFDPEYYLDQYEVKDSTNGRSRLCSGKYRDILSCQVKSNSGSLFLKLYNGVLIQIRMFYLAIICSLVYCESSALNHVTTKPDEEFLSESTQNVSRERRTFYCIPVPAVNSWVTHYEEEEYDSIGPVRTRGSGRSVMKRSASNNEMADLSSSSSTTLTLPDAKRICLERRRATSSSPQDLQPPSEEKGQSCLIKVYDTKEDLCLNDVVEVLGFLATEPLAEQTEGDTMDVESSEHNLPGSLVPRIHCVAIRKITQYNPLLFTMSQNLDAVFESAKSVHDDLHLVLTQVLLGDTLAADYLLCHLISSVYQRMDMLALGKLSLNIKNIPTCSNYIDKLYDILQLLLPKSQYLPMSLDNLNQRDFVPKKDYSSNRLKSGVLQLSAHTHLVLDETRLLPGQLDSNGVENISSLGTVITQQKVYYNFKFYKVEFNSDIPVLILSEGKSLLPSDAVVTLQPEDDHLVTETFEAARHFLHRALLDKIRVYLTVMMQADFQVPPHMQKRHLEYRSAQAMKQRSMAAETTAILFLIWAFSSGSVERGVAKTWGPVTPDQSTGKGRCVLRHQSDLGSCNP